MRVDKYLWTVRLFKTRSMATKACAGGTVLLNNEETKPSKEVKLNDAIAIRHTPIWRTYKVLDFPKSRVGAKLVPDYLIELTSQEGLSTLEEVRRMNAENKKLGIKGRPTKRDRRNLMKYKD